MTVVATPTSGAITDRQGIKSLLGGCCALCGCAHTGFGREPRTGACLAACRCGAMYQYRAGARRPGRINWYRAHSR